MVYESYFINTSTPWNQLTTSPHSLTNPELPKRCANRSRKADAPLRGGWSFCLSSRLTTAVITNKEGNSHKLGGCGAQFENSTPFSVEWNSVDNPGETYLFSAIYRGPVTSTWREFENLHRISFVSHYSRTVRFWIWVCEKLKRVWIVSWHRGRFSLHHLPIWGEMLSDITTKRAPKGQW